MTNIDSKFQTVCEHARHTVLLQTIADTLEWDERTGMPIGGGEYRVTQVSTLRAMAHSHLTEPRFGEQLRELLPSIDGEDKHGDVATTVRLLLRDWERDSKLPVDLVKRISQATVRG